MLRPISNFLVACSLLPAALSAGADELFSLEDPRGDDNGAGFLMYPNRDDMEPGDLDLVRLSAEQRSDGVWFIVELAQPIRDPKGKVGGLGEVQVDKLARYGFYTFNVDIYVDTDRIAGSGQVTAVPGRGVTIDRGYAWEKAIVLTPRPETARTMLQMHFDREFEAEVRAEQGRVTKDALETAESKSEAHVQEQYFFPSKIRVKSRQVEFLVPTDFLGGVPARNWGYTVLVTGADLEQTSRPGQLTPEKPAMFTMSVAYGNRTTQFGIRSDVDEATPPIVDLLAPDVDVQVAALTNYDATAGRRAAIPGMAPDGSVAVAPTGKPLTVAEATRIETAAAAAPAKPTASTAEKRAVPARLRTLNQLLEEGLITEAEYNELRRKILAEL